MTRLAVLLTLNTPPSSSMEHLFITILDRDKVRTALPALRKATGAPMGLLLDKVDKGEPAVEFSFGGNDIDESVARARDVLDDLDRLEISYRLTEMEEDGTEGTETSKELVLNAFDTWQDIDEDRMDLDDLRAS